MTDHNPPASIARWTRAVPVAIVLATAGLSAMAQGVMSGSNADIDAGTRARASASVDTSASTPMTHRRASGGTTIGDKARNGGERALDGTKRVVHKAGSATGNFANRVSNKIHSSTGATSADANVRAGSERSQ